MKEEQHNKNSLIDFINTLPIKLFSLLNIEEKPIRYIINDGRIVDVEVDEA